MKFPLTYGLNKTGLPLIPVLVGEQVLCFLIDTGATHNIVFSFVYEHFRNEFTLLNDEQSLMGVEGTNKTTPTIEATFNIEGHDITSVFSVLDATEAIKKVQKDTGVQLHGILGVKFLMENKWILDFKELEVRSNDGI